MGTGRASKRAKKLQNLHNYFHNKVEQVEIERNNDRTWQTKEHLIRLKKQKLAIKDRLQNE
jgi:uncharacterized protein YdcH (DUF465 family)|tara:strand:+ start:223 stop:405 length:183 start_codon:yes stop_codon:yes gene_type:complete